MASVDQALDTANHLARECDTLRRDVERLTKERDAARAQVERLRGALRRALDYICDANSDHPIVDELGAALADAAGEEGEG